MPKILKNRFLLDLNRSLSSPLSDSEQNNLQKEVFNDVHKLLTKFCTEIADNETPITFGLKRKNNVIYVHGARGAGKTTFLREILNFYQNTQSDNRIQNIKKIYPVAFIDPTLIDTHHSILVEIIGHFYSLVDEQLSFCQNPEKRIEFYKLLDLISNGMELFVTNETKYTECDASRHLTRTSNQPMLGRHLEKKINILIDEVSKILNIELFIVAIDDIDTNTDKAYEILEAIRCYLNHPRLAIIISGDLKMYSYIVRNKKSEELSTKDDMNKAQVNQLITHLEQQYLSKVFPIEQRIVLKKMDELVSKSNHIYVMHEYLSDNLLANEICQLLKNIFTQSLGIEKKYLNSYVKFILNQPIRSILQFIKTMIEAMQDGQFTSKALEQSLYHIFIGDIADEGVNTNLLSADDIYPIGYELFKLIIQHNDLETGFYAYPDGYKGQNSYNAAKLYLAASAMNLQDPVSNSLKVMLLVGANAKIYSNYIKNSGQEYCSLADYVDYIGLNRNDNITMIAARFSPIILQSCRLLKDKKVLSCGVMETYWKLDERTFDSATFIELLEKRGVANPKEINSLPKLAKKLVIGSKLDLCQYTAVATITMSAHRAITAVEQHDYISIYKLIASIAELLSNDGAKMTDLLTLINCSYPDFFNSTLKDDDKLVDIYHDEQSAMFHRTNDEPLQEAVRLNTLLKIWRENSKGINIKIPLLLSGKIWTGIFYSLSSISEDIKMQQSFQELAKDEQKFDCLLGDVFSRLVCGMINAVLVEEIRYHQSHYSEELINIILNSKDMATSDNELSYNLSKILVELNGDAVVEKMKHLLPLTSILISCPLLWPFLKSEKQFEVFSLILGDANSDFYNMLKPYMVSDNHELVISALPIMGCFSK